MSKRAAEYQGRKETGLDAGMASNSTEVPARATAAQLANRRIKSTRERRTRGNSPNPSTLGQQPPTNPFGSLNSNPTQAPASPAPAGANGFTFGQSQSFPPTSGTSDQATQNGTQSFSFGAQDSQGNMPPSFGGGGSAPSSFNFSAGPKTGPEQKINNPFSYAMSTLGASQSSGGSGFKGNIFNIPPAGGQNNTQNTPQQGGGAAATANQGPGMGTPQPQQQQQKQQQQPQNLFGFGNTAASSNNAFATSTAPASGNIFGKQTGNNTAKPNMFGAPQSTELANKPVDDAMETSPDRSKNTKPNIFGTSGAGQPSPSPTPILANLQSPKFSFGATSQFGGPSFSAPASQGPAATSMSGFNFPSATSVAAGTPLFGAPTTKPGETFQFCSGTATSGIMAPSTPGGTSLFGRTSMPDQGTAPAATSAPSLFASNPSFTAGGTTNTLFGAPINSQASSAATTPAPFTTGATAATSGPSIFASNPAFPPGGNTNTLFGAPSNPQEAPSATTSVPASSAPSIFGSNPPFSTGGNTNTLFGGAPSQPQQSPAATTSAPASSQPMFGSTSGFAPSASKANTLFGNTSQSMDMSTAPAAPAFSAATPAQSPSPSLFGAPTQPPATGSSVFDRATSPQESSSTTSKRKAEDKPDSAPATATAGSTAPSMFKPPTSGSGASMFPPSASTSGSTLFGAPKPAAAASTDNASKEQGAATTTQAKPLFGGVSQNQNNAPQSTMFSAPKAPSATDKERPPMFPPAKSQAQNMFAKPASQDEAKAVGLGTQPTATTATPKPKYVDQETQTNFQASAEWASLMPESIPDDVKTEEEREHYIKIYRLQALNTSFQNQIAGVDPAKEDIDNLVAFYVMLRTQIGMPTELTTLLKPLRPATADAFPPNDIPPFKRKADTTDDSTTTKRRRPSESESTDSTVPNATPCFAGPPGPSSSAKRKAPDDGETSDDQGERGQTGKRTRFGQQTNGVAASVEAGKQDGKKDDDTTTNTGKEGGTTGTQDGLQASKRSVSNTLQKFASSYVSQKSGSGHGPSESQSDSESSDESDHDDEEDTGKAVEKPNGTSSTSASPPSDGGRSLFDRVQKDEAGKPVRHVEAEQDASKDNGTENNKIADSAPSLFAGSKFASGLNASGTASPQFSFAGSSSVSRTPSPTENNTEATKTGTSIFAGLAPTSAPVNFSSPSPAPSPAPTSGPVASAQTGPAAATGNNGSSPSSSIFANMTQQAPTITFGSSPSTSASTPTASNNTTLFNTGIQQPKPLTPGQLGGPSLSPFAASGTSSTDISRSNTPAQSETGAEDSEEAAENLPQTDLTRGGAGEEDEDTLFEARSRALKMRDGSWEVQGTGLLRILKHRATGRARVLLRADPSGNVVLNSLLNAQIEYASNGKVVTFPVFAKDAAPEKWALRVKTEKDGTELATVMQNNKKAA